MSFPEKLNARQARITEIADRLTPTPGGTPAARMVSPPAGLLHSLEECLEAINQHIRTDYARLALAEAFVDPDGDVLYVVGSSEEITDRQTARVWSFLSGIRCAERMIRRERKDPSPVEPNH